MTVVNRLATIRLAGDEADRLGLGARLTLRRSWPRNAGHLLLEYGDGETTVAGQWLRDPVRLRECARRTSAGDGVVTVLPGAGVVLQQGVDRRLPALSRALAEPGARLVAHRPERRAVVRLPGGRYAKILRPDRVKAVVAAAGATTGLGFATPHLLTADARQGLTLWSNLAGWSWFDRLTAATPDEAAAAGVGTALRALHDAAPAEDLARHTGSDEADVLVRWSAHRRTMVGEGVPPHLLARVRARLAEPPGPVVMVHRDFYDKQAFMGEDGHVGLLDFDTLACGEAALDVANALSHVELRVLQDRLARPAGDRVAAAFLEAYRPGPEVIRRLPAYRAASRLRLWCVYGFRPRWRATVAPFATVEGLSSRIAGRTAWHYSQ